MVAHDSATDFLVTVLVSVKVYVNIGECVNIMAIPVSARSKAWVCGRSLAAIAGSNPAGNMDVSLSLVSVVCCQVEVSASG